MSAANSLNSDVGVEVITTARLHMGFFDLNGGLGRRFGSIGLALDQPATHLLAYAGPDIQASGPGSERAILLARKVLHACNIKGGVHFNLKGAIFEHAGLGSGTQMALAVGHAISKIYNLDLSIQDIAAMTSRGARSGIGLGTFASGGVVIDGGRAPDTIVPPVIARAAFPEAWRILLIFDRGDQGVHGSQEVAAFKDLPNIPEHVAANICRHVLMQALPALAEQNLTMFGQAIQALQVATGDYFAPVQGGRYASEKVASVLSFMHEQGAACYGQSSWGPTGFAIFADEAESASILDLLQTRYAATSLEFVMCKGLNRGAVVREITRPAT